MKTKLIIGVALVSLLTVVGVAAKTLFFDNSVSVKTDDANVKVGNGKVEVGSPEGSVSVNNGSVRVGAAGDWEADKTDTPVSKQKNVVLIVDSSGSMAERVTDGPKMNDAKIAAAKFIAGLTDDVNLSVVVYGHKGNNTQAQKAASCQGIEEVYYMGKVNDAIAQGKVSKLTPTGWTPIAYALQKAEGIVDRTASQDSENVVILLSDGEETCGGNPIQVAKALCSKNIKTHVIGFDVSGVSEQQLKDVATNGCGNYYSVDNVSEIESAFVQVGGDKINVQSFNTSVTIEGGNLKVTSPEGKVEIYENGDIDMKSSAGNVKIEDGKIDMDSLLNSTKVNY